MPPTFSGFYIPPLWIYFLRLCIVTLALHPTSEHGTHNKSHDLSIASNLGGVEQDHVNPDFADLALLLPLNLYGEK